MPSQKKMPKSLSNSRCQMPKSLSNSSLSNSQPIFLKSLYFSHTFSLHQTIFTLLNIRFNNMVTLS